MQHEYIKGRENIDKDAIKKLIGTIGYDDLKVLRKESTRELSKVRLRDRIKFTIYLQKEYVENFERARDWAFEKGMIKKRTRWAFTKFAVTNVIDMIMKEIDKERIAPVQSHSGVPLFVPAEEGDVKQS